MEAKRTKAQEECGLQSKGGFSGGRRQEIEMTIALSHEDDANTGQRANEKIGTQYCATAGK